MRKNKVGNVKMVYDCMLDSRLSDIAPQYADFFRYDGIRGITYSSEEMEAMGVDVIYTEYENIDDSDMVGGSDEDIVDRIMFSKMFPMVVGMGRVARMQGRDPGGFYIVGKLRRSLGGMQLVVCMMSFYSQLEKNLYLLTSLNREGVEITYKAFVRSDRDNMVGIQNMLQIMN
jgi:hypothetical protein